MSDELVLLDPQKFGLDPEMALGVQNAFSPKIAERDGMIPIYSRIIKAEITPALCKEAGDLMKKLVKVRTGIAEVHKVEKAFYFAAGKFVDAHKSRETLPVTQMEENLKAIRDHFENLEIERLAKLQAKRVLELKPYVNEGDVVEVLSGMTPLVWKAYLATAKTSHEEAVAEIARVAEEQRLKDVELANLRKENAKLKAAPPVINIPPTPVASVSIVTPLTAGELKFKKDADSVPLTEDFFYMIEGGGWCKPEKFLEEEDAKKVRAAIEIISAYEKQGIEKGYFQEM